MTSIRFPPLTLLLSVLPMAVSCIVVEKQPSEEALHRMIDMSRQLDEAQDLYRQGNFESSERKSEILIADVGSLTSRQRSELFVLRARLAYAYERKRVMRSWLVRLYLEDPDYRLDPLIDPPSVIKMWEQIGEEADVVAAKEGPEGPASRFAKELASFGRRVQEGTVYAAGSVAQFFDEFRRQVAGEPPPAYDEDEFEEGENENEEVHE